MIEERNKLVDKDKNRLLPMIGKLQRVPLRTVWRHEAYDFTTWLEENIEVLNDALNLSLDNVEREQAAGNFSVDLLSEDLDYGTVIIENQLERSDHDHLGKLITYLAAFEAKVAIWIVADPRPEHVAAISWLNESSPADFFLVKVEAVTINESPPAPLLTLITGPSIEARQVGATKKELSERHHIRQRFWAQLLDQARPKTDLHADTTPSIDSVIMHFVGHGRMRYAYRIATMDTKIAFYFDDSDAEANRRRFDQIMERQDQIEEVFGDPLIWDNRDGRKRCSIEHSIGLGGYRENEERWPKIQTAMIDAMIRLERALDPFINNLD